MPCPGSAGGLGGGPTGALAWGDSPGGDGCVWGVTLSFWPGSGSRPAKRRMTMPTTATMIQVDSGLRFGLAMSRRAFVKGLTCVVQQARCR